MRKCNQVLCAILVLCMVLPMCLIQVSAAKKTVEYKFYDESVPMATDSRTNFVLEDSAVMDTLKAKYDTNKAIPYAQGVSKSLGMHIYKGAITDNGWALGINDVLEKEWIALKIKNPGEGTFAGEVHFYRSSHTKAFLNVYILPGDTTDIASNLTAANLYASQKSTYQSMGNGLNTFRLDKNLVSDGSGEYIVVFQVDSFFTGNGNPGKVRMYFEGMTLTETSGSAVNPTTPKPTTPVSTNPTNPGVEVVDGEWKIFHSSLADLSYNDKGESQLSEQMETMNALYASGALNVAPYAWKTDAYVLLNNGSADTTSQFLFNGIKIQKATIGDWLALKIKSPGSGYYSVTVDFWYLNANNALEMDAYLLPANTAAANVGSMLTEENKLGTGTILSSTSLNSAVSARFTTGADMTAGQEYILVIQAAKDMHNEDSKRVDMFVTGITFDAGYDPGEGAFGPLPGNIAVKEPIRYAEVYRSASGVNPANGHDLLYLLFKGGTMLVYDVDDNQIVDEITGMSNTPFEGTVDANGNLWVSGSGSQLYFYNPATKQARKHQFDKGIFDGKSHNTYGVAFDELGYVYFAYWGYIGRLDPKTGEFINLSGTQLTTDPTKASDAQFAGYGGIYYDKGYLYLATYGDLNADGEYTSEFIKYDIANRRIAQAIDIRDCTHGSTQYAYGVSYISRVGDLLIGTVNGRPDKRVIIDISGEEMVRYDTIGDFNSHFLSRFSDEINGKYYVTGYVDDESTARCVYEVDPVAMTVTRLGDIVVLATMGTKHATVTVDGLPGLCIVAPFNNTATGQVDLAIYNIETKQTIIRDTLSEGYGSSAMLQPLAMDPSGRYLATGAYGNNQLSIYDLETGEVFTRLGYGHQSDNMIWYQGILWIGNYNTGCITRYDPVEDEVTPLTNLMDSVFQQKRMWCTASGGGKVFFGTVPDSNRFGGALMWYDIAANRTYVTAGPNPEDVYYADTSASFVVWRNAVTHQIETFDVDGDGVYDYNFLLDDKGTEDSSDDQFTQRYYGVMKNRVICGIQYKDGYLYCATTKENGQGVGPQMSEGNAEIFVYDLTAMKVIGVLDVADHIQGLENTDYGCIDKIDFIAADPYEDGKFWCLIGQTLFSFTYDIPSNTFSVKEELSFGKNIKYAGDSSGWCGRSIVFDGDYLYADFHHNGIWMVNTSNPAQHYQVTNFDVMRIVQPKDGNLYYLSKMDGSGRLSIMKLDSAIHTEPLVATSVQKVIDALPATVTMENEKQVLAAYRMYMDLSDGAKALVDAAKLNGLVSSLDADLAAKCDQMIDTIGTVTLQSERAVQNARDYYDALPDSAKTLVTKLEVLEAAEKALAEAKQNAHLNPSVNTNQTAENNSSWIVIGVVAAVLVAAAGAVAFIVVRKKKSAKEE